MSVTSPALTIQDLPALSRLLDEAWELDVSARQHWLQTLPPEHARLKSKLEEMLSKSAGMETDVFVKGAHDAAETLIHERGSGGASAAWQADADIGGYRLIRELGLGGMGAVWLAERSGGELKRQVALKLPLFSIHNKALAERFNRERDILASLTHPNIARLYDAGTTSTGQPYLALERVEGQAITQHCNAPPSNAQPGNTKPLTIDARIHLFLQVLDAVQYAHSNLVLHRDLKPANVMVTADGQVKLLDFGIAKLISATDIPAEETALTQVGGHALTPDYASPEQIAGSALTTASDVYSLGVLLYELLVGERPYKLKGQGRAALEEAILNTEPVKPSHRVRTTERINTSTSTRKKIANKLAGDLDTILLKALKKKPSDRYETAAAFAADLKRYLSGEAVDAQPDSNWYRLRKLIGRNKLAVGSAAAVMVALIAGAGVATWQAQQANLQRAQVAKEAIRAESIGDFFSLLIDDFGGKGNPFTMTELLQRGEQMADQQYVGTPALRAELLARLADRYHARGDSAHAMSLIETAAALARTSHDVKLEAQMTCLNAFHESASGKHDEALRTLASAFVKLSSERDADLVEFDCLTTQAWVLSRAGKTQMAIDSAERAISIQRGFPSGMRGRESPLAALASAYRAAGRFHSADQTYTELASQFKSGERTRRAKLILNNWAVSLNQAGQITKSSEICQRAIGVGNDVKDPDAVHLALSATCARQLLILGQKDEAHRLIDQLVSKSKEGRNDTFYLIGLLLTKADYFYGVGEVSKFSELLTETETLVKANFKAGHSRFGEIERNRARLAVLQGNFDGALSAIERAISIFDLAAPNSNDSAMAYITLAQIHSGRREFDKAEAASGRAIKKLDEFLKEKGYSYRIGLANSELGIALQGRNDIAGAREAFKVAMTHLRATLGGNAPDSLRLQELVNALNVSTTVKQ
jgi:eukaryotic-like serine/threonine-protein kinase